MRQRDPHAHAAAIGTFAQEHGLPRREADGATGSFDVTVVFNFIGNEKRRTAIADFDLPVVDNAGQRWGTVEFPAPATVLRREAIRGGHNESAGLDE